jgi:hypothetical protein
LFCCWSFLYETFSISTSACQLLIVCTQKIVAPVVSLLAW